MDNALTLRGNITSDPVIRFTPSGIPVVSFDIAINRRWTDRASGETREAVTFVPVQCWQQLAENVAESLHKGQRVIVDGRIEQNNWTADDGTARSQLRMVADDVGMSMRFGKANFTRVDRRASTSASETSSSASETSSSAGPAGEEEPF